jgi:hypothetical protein
MGPHIFITVKGKGFYAYNMIKSEMTASIVHPFLTSIDKVTKKQDQNEYVGVLVDQEQKDIK